SPSLECLDHISLNARVPQEHPRLINEEGFKAGGDLPVGNDRVRAMQDVKKQGFQKFWVSAHLLEVEALKLRKRNCVRRIVEEKAELTAANPLGKPLAVIVAQRVRQYTQGAKIRLDFVETFDLAIEVALCGGIEFTQTGTLQKD